MYGKNEMDQLRVEMGEQQAIDLRENIGRMALNHADFEAACAKRREDIPKELDAFEKFLGQR